MAKKKTTEVEEVKEFVKTKPSLSKKIHFTFGEINVVLLAIPTREAFDTLYRGKLQRTDIETAWAEAQKLRSKYAD